MTEKKTGASDVVVPGRLTIVGAPGLEVVITKNVYDAVSSVSSPSQAAATHEAAQKFEAISDRDLYVMAKDDQPVGQRIGVAGVHESTLKALAAYESNRRERRKDALKWGAALVVGILTSAAMARLIS